MVLCWWWAARAGGCCGVQMPGGLGTGTPWCCLQVTETPGLTCRLAATSGAGGMCCGAGPQQKG